MSFKVAKVVFNLPVNKTFDYLIPETMTVEPGMRVWAEFNRSFMVGLVRAKAAASKFDKLKPISAVLDQTPLLSREHLVFAEKLEEEYPYSAGELAFTMIPPIFRRKRFIKEELSSGKKYFYGKGPGTICLCRTGLLQRLEAVRQRIASALEEGSVLIVFPLVSQVETAFNFLEKIFPGKCLAFHSGQKDKEFSLSWYNSRRGFKLILGTRAALFYYPDDLSLLVVEDENHPCHFQPEKPFYHIPEAAGLLSRFKKIPLILSSDLPSLKTYAEVKDGSADLDEEITASAAVEVRGGRTFFYRKNSLSLNLLVRDIIRKNLEERKRLIVFYNRRGFSTLLKCSICGYVFRCPHCGSPLKCSLSDERGICFRCDHKEKIPSLCPQCRKGAVRSMGAGIEKIKTELVRNFPSARIAFFEDKTPGTDIVLSTYSVMENIGLNPQRFDVGLILDSDDYLSHVDYSAVFKLFLFLKRLSSAVREKALLITENRGLYLWDHVNAPWQEFYEQECGLRREADLPPYYSFARITLRGTVKKTLLNKAVKLYNVLAGEKEFSVFGPLEASPFKSSGKFHYAVMVKAADKKFLRRSLKKALKSFRSGSQRIAVEIE